MLDHPSWTSDCVTLSSQCYIQLGVVSRVSSSPTDLSQDCLHATHPSTATKQQDVQHPSTLSLDPSIKHMPPISIIMPTIPGCTQEVIHPLLDIQPAPFGMDALHLLPLLALTLALLDPQFLKVDIRAVEDTAGVTLIRTFLAAKEAELRGSEFLRDGVV
jgi:hypothetical protein